MDIDLLTSENLLPQLQTEVNRSRVEAWCCRLDAFVMDLRYYALVHLADLVGDLRDGTDEFEQFCTPMDLCRDIERHFHVPNPMWHHVATSPEAAATVRAARGAINDVAAVMTIAKKAPLTDAATDRPDNRLKHLVEFQQRLEQARQRCTDFLEHPEFIN